MTNRDLDLFLLGIAVGALGTLERVCQGEPASVIDDAARRCLAMAGRNLRAESASDSARGERLNDLVVMFTPEKR